MGEVFRTQYWPEETVGDHLEVALKYDGVNLALLAKIFEKVSPRVLIEYIKSKPLGNMPAGFGFSMSF